MRIEYDAKHDLLNIEFLPGEKIQDSREIDGMVFDYDRRKRLVAVEILDASKRTSKKPLETIEFALAASR